MTRKFSPTLKVFRKSKLLLRKALLFKGNSVQMGKTEENGLKTCWEVWPELGEQFLQQPLHSYSSSRYHSFPQATFEAKGIQGNPSYLFILKICIVFIA